MKTINDGGAAFPMAPYTSPRGDFEWGASGMTLRQWYAGLAMQGLAPRVGSERQIADWAVQQADALIKRLNETDSQEAT